MSNTYHEDRSNTVSGASCSYKALGNYNQGNVGMSPPVPRGTSSGFQVVPAWEHRPQYNTLVKGNGCGGYANVMAAYGKDAGRCEPKYVKKPCM